MQGAYLVHRCMNPISGSCWLPLCDCADEIVSVPPPFKHKKAHLSACMGEHTHGLRAACHPLWWEQYTISSIILSPFHSLFSLV